MLVKASEEVKFTVIVSKGWLLKIAKQKRPICPYH